ncbi:unnamed protein product [Fraxinus pennsylvanica]|uniref:Uncharacterized protein n=1 Tax=Fraxinus pennsylvanica TaxID=56036 RepID=A0AAD2DZJ8_9LAMI|nr:unnamed protein product [Fraxinus pennsylvanica]
MKRDLPDDGEQMKRRWREGQELIAKLKAISPTVEIEEAEPQREEVSAVVMEDTRKKMVSSDNKVRQLEAQIREEQRTFASNRKKVEELEHERKKLRNELEHEKAAREEAGAKVSALNLEHSAFGYIQDMPQSKIVCYAKIAVQLKKKTVCDVPLHCRWMTVSIP